MIDLHCHLDLIPDALSLLKTVELKNSFTLVVTTSPRGWLATSRVFSDVRNVECAIGLHPEIISQKLSEIHLFFDYLHECRFIGEVGVDNSNASSSASLSMQRAFFTDVIKESNFLGGKIISIHSRNAEAIVLDILEKENNLNIPILHWFTGSQIMLKRAVEMDCYFSIGPAMLKSANGKRLVEKIPLNRILPESDGPFAQLNGQPVMPWEAINISSQLAKMFGCSQLQIVKQLYNNFKELLMNNGGSPHIYER